MNPFFRTTVNGFLIGALSFSTLSAHARDASTDEIAFTEKIELTAQRSKTVGEFFAQAKPWLSKAQAEFLEHRGQSAFRARMPSVKALSAQSLRVLIDHKTLDLQLQSQDRAVTVNGHRLSLSDLPKAWSEISGVLGQRETAHTNLFWHLLQPEARADAAAIAGVLTTLALAAVMVNNMNCAEATKVTSSCLRAYYDVRKTLGLHPTEDADESKNEAMFSATKMNAAIVKSKPSKNPKCKGVEDKFGDLAAVDNEIKSAKDVLLTIRCEAQIVRLHDCHAKILNQVAKSCGLTLGGTNATSSSGTQNLIKGQN